MTHFVPFTTQHLETACRVLGDTERGLTGPQIGRLLREIGLPDPCQTMTKWKRLFKALASAQNRYRVGNHLILLIDQAAREADGLRWCRDELNAVLSFSGLYVRKDGRVAFLANG
ncbi:hypothetical protein N234_11992 [Ralstonia pickettii DTP0602]|nr:hypothetical protein N234_11992 [Ralstonia pickettii DTP0602]